MITLLVLNYLTRVQIEYYFSSDAYVNVIEKNGMILFFLCAKTVGIRKQYTTVNYFKYVYYENQFAIIWYYFHNCSFNSFPGIILQKTVSVTSTFVHHL